MKRILVLSVIAAMTFSACASKTSSSFQPLPDGIEDNLHRTGINTCPYEYFHTPETQAPAGYRPFYISHYGRHGSRSNWESPSYGKVLNSFEKAHEAGILTEEGEKAYETVKTVISLHNHMDGRLTPLGAKEHRQIADRMYNKYNSVFSGAKKVRAVSSVVPRCIVSMAAFTGELLSHNSNLDISWDTGEEYMNYLSSEDTREKRHEAREIINEYRNAHVRDTMFFASHIFTDIDKAHEVVGSIDKMTRRAMEIAIICGSFELDDSLLRCIAPEDLEYSSKIYSLDLYLRQCNSVEFGDSRMAVPEMKAFMDDFISKADEAIAGGPTVADLRFGHDYHLLAIAALIGVKGIAERLTAEEAMDWPGWLYTPFAGNLQAVFYRNKAGNILVKFFINEREATLLNMEGGPYYDWQALKEAWAI